MLDQKVPAPASEPFFQHGWTTRYALVAVAVIVTACAVYWPGLAGPLVFDDIHNLSPLTEWLQGRQGWTSVVFGNSSGTFGRPVSMASLIVNVKALGPEVWGLKFGNLLIHLLNGGLVFWLFKAILNNGGLIPEPHRYATWAPLLGASIWLLHPLLVSTVLYVVQRMAMLSALFVLLAIITYLHGRAALLAGQRRKAIVLLALVPVWTVLATLSKENGILAPALCAVIELCVFTPKMGKRRSWPSVAFLLGALLLPALIAAVLTLAQHDAIAGGYANRAFSLPERLLTQPRVLWSYIGNLILPHGPQLGLYHDDYPVSHSLFSPVSTVLAALAWILVIVVAWRTRRTIPGLAAGLGIFLVGHALESTVFPLLMYFEHRNYLPAVGAIWAVLSLAAATARRLWDRMHHPLGVFVSAAACLLIVLALTTVGQTSTWATQQTILAQGLKYHPDSRWLRLDLIANAMKKDPPDAKEARSHSSHLLGSPNSSTRRMGALSRLLIDCSLQLPAEQEFVRIAFSGQPEPLEADLLRVYETLADGVASRPCPGLTSSQMADETVQMLDRSVLPPGNLVIWRLRFKSASLYLTAGRDKEAVTQARLALSGGTADPQVAVFLAQLYFDQGKAEEALSLLSGAASNVRADDFLGRKIISEFQNHILAERSSSASPP